MTGKDISTEILVGQVTTTAWDYCHKIVSFYRYACQYDDIGNRRSSLERGVQSAEYVANNLNQYTSIEQLVLRSLGEGGSNNFSPAYDLDGNQTLVKTSTGVWQVTYNGENRPVRWVRGNTVVTMDFDSMGRRTFYRETENGTEVSASRFFYDGYLMIQQLDHDSPHAVQKEFIWDPTEPVATKPLVFRQNGMDSPYLTHDGNKNVADVIRAAPYNDSVGHYEYAPFGAVTSAVGSRAMDNPFRFSSEYADDTLGLVYFNYRHYWPGMGRWLVRDKMLESVGLNMFAFVGNIPTTYQDYRGLYLFPMSDYFLQIHLTETPKTSLRKRQSVKFFEEYNVYTYEMAYNSFVIEFDAALSKLKKCCGRDGLKDNKICHLINDLLIPVPVVFRINKGFDLKPEYGNGSDYQGKMPDEKPYKGKKSKGIELKGYYDSETGMLNSAFNYYDINGLPHQESLETLIFHELTHYLQNNGDEEAKTQYSERRDQERWKSWQEKEACGQENQLRKCCPELNDPIERGRYNAPHSR